jgi:malate dehydrogenase (oxaloacetate-decarboxylating)
MFRGALDVKARAINDEMKKAAVYAIADLITPEELSEDYIIVSALDKRVVERIAKAVGKAAIESGAAAGE